MPILSGQGGGSASIPSTYPKGKVAYAETSTDTTGITTTTTDLTGLSVTFTAETGRRYLITGNARFSQSGSNSNPEFRIRNGSNTTINRSTGTMPAGEFDTRNSMAVDVPGAGSVTYKLSMSTGLGTLATTFGADQKGFILVEDIGT